MHRTDIQYHAGELPSRPEPPADDLWAYEPDRESPERLRIMVRPTPAPHTYLSDGRDREERLQAPKRSMSITSPS